ncbi:carotenoid oxygenase family protein [Gephyromycinifex aptenodytis]|uniref:carotenoid oxygenase family protein n=1 Tax=Gephyromycinifex aptenodytis TaxID=2716227 RepID=UPI0014474A1F|nr:carotenoid oxygenase family protein [Gephyromycinifex aptenodytis]
MNDPNALILSVPREDETDNPWLKGAFRSQRNELTVSGKDLQIIGEIPADLDGVYIRNTHNQAQMPLGLYHPFDGDGMLHAIRFEDGKCEYRNRFVRTTGFLAEQAVGKSLWPGLLQPDMYTRRGWGAMGAMKDNAGTDVVGHAGKLYPTMSQCSEPWVMSPYTLETSGATASWAALVPDGVSSHQKVDVETGDMIFFNYNFEQAPYLNYGVVSGEDKLVHYVPIDLPGHRWLHDIGMTKNYSLLHDIPYFFDKDGPAGQSAKLSFHDNMPFRIGVIPRFGRSEDVRWFEFEPSFLLHIANCYEDGDWIIHDGCRWDNLGKMPVGDPNDPYAKIARNLDKHATQTHMYRWMLNVRTGETKEYSLDDEVTEFPIVGNDWVGKTYRYSYNSLFVPGHWYMCGLKRYDLLRGDMVRYEYGDQRYGSEVCVAQKIGSTEEDAAYVITFVNDMAQDRSECLIFDAADIEAGPICTVVLPERIAAGTHACWVEGDRMDGENRGSGLAKMHPLTY